MERVWSQHVAAVRRKLLHLPVTLADRLHRSKGRFDRTWHAPAGGLWGCLLHVNTLLPQSRNLISLAVGVACCEAVREVGIAAELRRLGWIIGQHHAHMIPRGLPGAGHILVFDNGGWAGYGAPNPGSSTGFRNALRDYSRVLEIDPVSLKVVWQYTPVEAGLAFPVDANRFYSPFISSAQRLPNGNTLITEGSGGRLIEVTAGHEIVWEYISPYQGRMMKINMIYRAYRLPYAWVPQIEAPREQAIERIDVSRFRVPGASPGGAKRIVHVAGVLPYRPDAALCVRTDIGETV